MLYLYKILKIFLFILPCLMAESAFANESRESERYNPADAYFFDVTYYFDKASQQGFYLDFNESKVKTENRLKSDRLLYSLGSETSLVFDNNIYLKSQISLSGIDNQMNEIEGGIAENEKKTFSVYSGVSAGYISKIDSNTAIVPEIGVSYLRASNSQADYFFKEIPGYASSVGKTNYDAMYASLMINLLGDFSLDDNSAIQPSIGVGFRRNISGSEVVRPLNLMRNDSVLDTNDESSVLVQTGITWTDENSSVDLHYNGEYGNEKKFHSGEIKIKYKF